MTNHEIANETKSMDRAQSLSALVSKVDRAHAILDAAGVGPGPLVERVAAVIGECDIAVAALNKISGLPNNMVLSCAKRYANMAIIKITDSANSAAEAAGEKK